MSKKMSRQEAIEVLRTFRAKYELDEDLYSALGVAIRELRKPTDAELMDAFLEKVVDKGSVFFRYKGEKHWSYNGNLIFKERVSGCDYGNSVDLETLFDIIQNQHLIEWELPKKKLTNEQIKLLSIAFEWGFIYLAMDEDEVICLFSDKPIKVGDEWGITNVHGNATEVKGRSCAILRSLVSWDDEEPFDIKKALIDAGVEVQQ